MEKQEIINLKEALEKANQEFDTTFAGNELSGAEIGYFNGIYTEAKALVEKFDTDYCRMLNRTSNNMEG